MNREGKGTFKTMVAIPAYNEEISIGSMVALSKKYADIVLVIDDGSKDRTSEIAESLGAVVIRHRTNHGKAWAVRSAFKAARKSGVDALVLVDGDGQHDPGDIPRFVNPIKKGKAHVVLGSRFIDKEGTKEMPGHRKAGNLVLSGTTSLSALKWVSDSQCGYRSFSKKTFGKFSFNEKDGFGVESSMIVEASRMKFRIIEIPVTCKYDGLKGAHTRGPLGHGLMVLTFILGMVRDRHPLIFFGVPGLVMMGIGIAYGLQKFYYYQQFDTLYLGPVIFATFLTLAGMLSVFTALILNSMQNIVARMKRG